MNKAGAHELELRGVSCVRDKQEILREISVGFAAGRLHLLRGAVEDGRDLLLRVLGLLHAPDAGEVLVQGGATRGLDEEALAALRTQRFGFVFAAPFLLSSFTVIENVAMPLFKISQVGPEEARRRTEALLEFAGIADAAETVVDELAPPAQYRVALARGLVNEPSFLIVEDLDGAMEKGEWHAFIETLRRVTDAFGTTVIATASPGFPLAGRERVLDIALGRITGDTEGEHSL